MNTDFHFNILILYPQKSIKKSIFAFNNIYIKQIYKTINKWAIYLSKKNNIKIIKNKKNIK